MSRILIVANDNLENLISGAGSEALRIKSHINNLFARVSVDVWTFGEKKKSIKEKSAAYFCQNKPPRHLETYDALLLFFSKSEFIGIVADRPAKSQTKIIIDLYNPLILEKMTYNNSRRMMEVTSCVKKIISRGDFFLCASERQKDYYFGLLSGFGKSVKADDVAVVPTILDKPVRSNKTISAAKTDFVFFGGIYPWFDVDKIIIFARKMIAKNYSVSFLGAQNPGVRGIYLAPLEKLSAAFPKTAARQVVFENWTSGDKLSQKLSGYRFAVNLVRPTLEDIYAYRTRLLTLLAHGIPLITNGHDEISRIALISGAGFAWKDFNEKAALQQQPMLSKKCREVFAKLNVANKNEKKKLDRFLSSPLVLPAPKNRVQSFFDWLWQKIGDRGF